MWSFLSALILLCGVALGRRDRDQIGTAATLLANWSACAAYGFVTGDPWSWQTLFAIDFTTAILLIVVTGSRPPLIVVGIYLAMCVAHAATGIMGAHVDSGTYVRVLSALAWAQVLVTGGWIGHSIYRRSFGGFDPVRGGAVVAAGAAVVEAKEPRP